jgi:hypothetical protein
LDDIVAGLADASVGEMKATAQLVGQEGLPESVIVNFEVDGNECIGRRITVIITPAAPLVLESNVTRGYAGPSELA